MAGVRDDLILDISQAQRAITALENQIQSATSGIALTVNTAGLTQEINRAVDAASTGVTVTADTRSITPEITGAVQAADTNVQVDADTTDARREVRLLGKDLDETGKSADRLKTLLTVAAGTAAARGLFALANAASALNEQVTGSEVVFKAAATEVQRFSREAQRIGIGNTQALQLSNTFGGLAISAGLASNAAADFATTIVERAADIASLRDLDLTQTLDALRSGLVGETEPLRNLGIFINEVNLQAKAMQLGLADASGEVSDAAKIQARYAIILEQSEIAAGNFALTSNGLANQQRQVRAELENLAAEAGQVLEPAFLSLIQLGRQDLLPMLEDLAETALPAVASILVSLAPLLTSTLQILVAISPVLTVVADVLDAIPTPLLAAAGGALLFNRAFGGLTSLVSGTGTALSLFPQILRGTAQTLPAASAGVGGLATGITGLASGLANVNPLVIAGGLAVATYLSVTSSAREEERRFKEEVEQASAALTDQAGVLKVTTDGLAAYVEESSRFNSKDQVDDLNRIGLSFRDVASLADNGAEGFNRFADAAIRNGEVTEIFRDELNRTVDAQGNFVNATNSSVEINGRLFDGNTSLIRSFDELQRVTNATAQAELESRVAKDELTQAQLDAAIAANTAAGGAINYAAALQSIDGSETIETNREIKTRVEQTTDALDAARTSLDRFQEGLDRAFGDKTLEAAIDRRTQAIADLANGIRDRANEVAAAQARLDGILNDPDSGPDERADAERELQEAIADTSLSLDGNSEAALRNREELRSLSENVADVITKNREQGATLGELQFIRAAEIANLREQLTQMGFNRAEIDRYIADIEEIPLTKSTTVTVETATAEANLKAALDRMQRQIDLNPLSIDVIQAEKFVIRGVNAQPRRKGGEFVPGAVLVGEDGPELRWESRAGFISTAAETRQLLAVLTSLQERTPAFGVRDLSATSMGQGATFDYDRLGRAIAAALPASGDSVKLVVQGATLEDAHATATETVRQLRAERYRQTGMAG